MEEAFYQTLKDLSLSSSDWENKYMDFILDEDIDMNLLIEMVS